MVTGSEDLGPVLLFTILLLLFEVAEFFFPVGFFFFFEVGLNNVYESVRGFFNSIDLNSAISAWSRQLNWNSS